MLQAEGLPYGRARALRAADEPDRWQLLATTAPEIRQMLVDVYATLRSAGRSSCSSQGAGAASSRASTCCARLRCACSTTVRRPRRSVRVSASLELIEASVLPERLLALSEMKARGVRAAAFTEARDAVVAAALEDSPPRPRPPGASGHLGAVYAEAKARESALDFEDLQLRAETFWARRPGGPRASGSGSSSIMVDEFQDTNRLQTDC